MTAPGGRCDRPSPPLIMEETITISRLRYESIIFFAITGWMIALFLFGIFIGASL